MSHLSASFSATLRVRLTDAPGSFARLAKAIGDAGGSFGAIDLVRVEKRTKIRDVTVEATDADHLHRIVEAVRAVDGVEVERVSDRTFLMHLGGKIEMRSKVPVKTRDDLSMAYTPGVARISEAIAEERDLVWNLTIKQNTVAVVSDGTAVLGLGDIGPEAAMPVMEGKALLFKEFGGVDAWPLCLATKDPDEIVAHREGDRTRVRRHQPRGHLVAALLRDRAASARGARHPGLPRRPARDGGRRPRGAAERAARRRQGARARSRSWSPASGAAGVAVDEHPPERRCATGSSAATTRAPSTSGATGSAASRPPTPSGRTRTARAAAPTSVLAGADVYLGLSVPGAVSRRGDRADERRRDRVRDGEPDARDRAREPPAREGDRGRHGTLRLPEPDQQRARVPGHLPRRAGRRAPARSPRT